MICFTIIILRQQSGWAHLSQEPAAFITVSQLDRQAFISPLTDDLMDT